LPATTKFSKHYPKLYDAFLLSKDDPMDSELNFKRMQSTIQSMPPYNQIEPKALRTFIITMQALQVGLSIMARKAYYQNDLTDEAVIDILDNTGNILINQLKTKGAL
jgi:hypothetical protein